VDIPSGKEEEKINNATTNNVMAYEEIPIKKRKIAGKAVVLLSAYARKHLSTRYLRSRFIKR
jgi:hypothetical protein